VIVHEEPGLCGLELWRARSGSATLDQLRERKSEYFQALRGFLVRLHYGKAAVDDAQETEALLKAEGFVRVVFCGGDALHPELKPIFCAAPLPFSIAIGDGLYAAHRGARHIFQTMGWRQGIAVDLGQLQLKVMTARQNRCLPRDFGLLPFGAHAIDAATGRGRLRTFIREGVSGVGNPDGVVLALPVALDCHGVAQPATYPGLFGPVEAIFSDLFACPLVVLNDAVLAAIGFRPEAGEKTLVVTLGFGIGGALWDG
jgi:hypothetical protein